MSAQLTMDARYYDAVTKRTMTAKGWKEIKRYGKKVVLEKYKPAVGPAVNAPQPPVAPAVKRGRGRPKKDKDVTP